MPNCFQLLRKNDPEAGPVVLQKVDEEICQALGLPCDEKQWACGWYNYIGFSLAMGEDWNQIKAKIERIKAEEGPSELWDQMERIRQWLEENFVSSAWYERKAC